MRGVHGVYFGVGGTCCSRRSERWNEGTVLVKSELAEDVCLERFWTTWTSRDRHSNVGDTRALIVDRSVRSMDRWIQKIDSTVFRKMAVAVVSRYYEHTIYDTTMQATLSPQVIEGGGLTNKRRRRPQHLTNNDAKNLPTRRRWRPRSSLSGKVIGDDNNVVGKQVGVLDQTSPTTECPHDHSGYVSSQLQ